jgi:hypothetical protein
MSLAKNSGFWLQLPLQLTVFAVVRTRSWLFKAAGEVAYWAEVNRYERDQLGLAVRWSGSSPLSLTPYQVKTAMA